MSMFTSRQVALVWMTLAFFAPLFSLGGPTIPGVRLGSDAQPLATAFNCVSVVSGKYFIAEPNLVIEGPEPLSYSLTYDSGVLNNDGLAWGWHLQLPWRQGFFTIGKENNQKTFLFCSEEGENTNVVYKNVGSPGSTIEFQIAENIYDLAGYINVAAGSISGQNNLHNNRAAYQGWAKDYGWGNFVVTSGSGSLRFYEWYTFANRHQWRLAKEIQPNGCQVHYSYCAPHHLSRIHTTNPSGTLVLNSIDFVYDAAGYTAQASNGQSVRYNIDKVHLKRHFANGLKMEGDISHLREMVPSGGVSSSHSLCTTKEDGLWTQNDRREWPDGRFLNVIHQKPDGKVQALQAPAGSDATPVTIASFAYGKNYTCVADALGSATVFRYSKENRITSIQKCQLGGKPYSKKMFLWDMSATGKGNLLCTAQVDEQKALASSCTAFSYDGAGNITQELLFGNLTGRGVDLFSVGADLRPTTVIERNETLYTYSADGRNLRLSEKQSNGLFIRYTYKPGTNLLVSKLTGDATRILFREFHAYDEDHFLIRTIMDDGTSASSDQMNDVTVRTLKVIKPRKEAPAIGFPDQVVHQYWDPQTNQDRQLRRIQYSYNLGDQVTHEDIYDAEDQFQYSLTYAYDEKRNLIAQSDALGRITQFTYDANKNKLSEELLDSGVRTNFRYDLMNRLIAREEVHTDGTFLVTSYKYDYLGNKVAEVDTFGNETHFVYDEFSRLIETILPLQEAVSGSVTPSIKQSYNSLDQCVRQTNAIGHVTEMRYNIRNQPCSVLNPDGTQERHEYTLDGKLDKHWNIQGTLTQYTYDILGRPVEKAEYDANGKRLTSSISEYTGSQLTRVINSLGVVTEYAYDGAGRKCKEACAGSRTEYGYDALGRLSHTKSWHGPAENDYTVTIQEFDLLDRVTEERMEDVVGKLLHKKAYVYDIQGNRTHELLYSSPTAFTVSEVRYNTRKQPVEIIDAQGNRTHITYDFNHRNAIGQRVLLKTTTDALGQQVADVHDAHGRLVASTTRDPFGNQVAGYRQIYDATGNLIRRIDDVWVSGELQSQRITTSSFDAGKRITHLCEAFGTVDERSTRFSYNRFGQIESIVLPGGISLHHTYDALGHLETYCASDNSFDYHYEYDAVGNVLKILDQLNHTATTRTYDALNQMTAETLGNGLHLDYTRDDQGRLTGLTLPDATTVHWKYEGRFLKQIHRLDLTHVYTARDLIGNVLGMTLFGRAGVVTYQYDKLQRPISITSSAYKEQIPADGYDAAHNLLKHSVADAFGNRELRYQYDALYQLTREEGAVTQVYAHDSLHNRISKGDENYSVNAVHSLLQAGSIGFVNDARGNRIGRHQGDESTSYQYDALGRLTVVEKGSLREEYVYDSFNRRLSARSSKKDPTGNWLEHNTLRFLYSDQNEIGAVDNAGKITQLRILGDGRGAEIGAAVAMELNGKYYAPIHDLRGNVVAVVDSFGKVVESMQYSAFGEEKCLVKGSSLSRCPWHFSSKRLDEATGLTCFGRRYYDSTVGRWLTPDPIGYKAGPNLYAYVHNSPLTHFDLYGLYSEKNNPYRDGNYSITGPAGRGIYNTLSDPWGTSCRYGGYACQLGSSIWNRDFSSISQGWNQLGEGRSNFFKERMGEIVAEGALAPAAVRAGAAYTAEAGATGAAYLGRMTSSLASQGMKAGARCVFNRQGTSGDLTAEAQSAPQIVRCPDIGNQTNRKIWNYTRRKTSVQKAYEHWKDHRHEFPDLQNAKQYVEATQDFLNNPPTTALSRFRPKDGAFIVYDTKTQMFAVRDPNGLPRTMYKLDPKLHEYENNLKYFYGQ